LRSNTILTSIILSASILFFAVTKSQSNSGKYYIPSGIEYRNLTKPVQKQVDCLAQNIYFEAAHESKDGQVAVALVTLNRLASGNYGSDVCSVVTQKTNNNGSTVCQFSWVCQTIFTNKLLTIGDTLLYNNIRDLAVYVLMNYEVIEDNTKGATYYHADYVDPQWGLPKTIKIGRHIFYKKYADVQSMKKELKL